MKLKSRLFLGYVLVIVLYGLLTLLPAPSAAAVARLHASPASIRLAVAVLVLLEAAIWLAGFYGYGKFSSYARMIKGTDDGVHVEQLQKGLFVLILWQPVSSIVSSALSYPGAKHTISLQFATIVSHYVSLGLALGSYILISRGARGLRLT